MSYVNKYLGDLPSLSQTKRKLIRTVNAEVIRKEAEITELKEVEKLRTKKVL
ncbi:hypothetical protein [Arsenicibacter rosenii]|uniref:hypothetical protein n=1 Tax=Arsenicibacter rosenii TaxID=1750698 RepID=UPI0015A6F953|nr:hypothetical protein [Arsenicibacter rosenii]